MQSVCRRQEYGNNKGQFISHGLNPFEREIEQTEIGCCDIFPWRQLIVFKDNEVKAH